MVLSAALPHINIYPLWLTLRPKSRQSLGADGSLLFEVSDPVSVGYISMVNYG